MTSCEHGCLGYVPHWARPRVSDVLRKGPWVLIWHPPKRNAQRWKRCDGSKREARP